MSFNKYYNENTKQIKSIHFKVQTNNETKKYSVTKRDPFGINIPYSYDNYEPKKGGLVDTRMGTSDPYIKCTTCNLDSNDCDGHFGHTELSLPVFHWGFLSNVEFTLKSICKSCSEILIEKTPENIKMYEGKNEKQRAKITKDLVKKVKFCYNCGTSVSKIKRDVNKATGVIKIVSEKEVMSTIVNEQTNESSEIKKNLRENITARDCYNIFRNISDTDCFLLGYDVTRSRPEDLILLRMPIPPVCIRPSSKISLMSSATKEDSLTLKLADIINSNIRVRNELNKDGYEDLFNLLQYHVATFFDNDSSSLPKAEFKTGSQPIKSISDRIKGKEGRIRSNLCGKRVNFSARSVITSDPNIGIDEVGVPLKVAKNLTIPEEVTPQNIAHLTKLVKNGSTNYPGANYVIKHITINGKSVEQKIDLNFRKSNIKLQYGDIVERHMVNGDYLLFNRQPTLHKIGMMGHRAHILEREDSNTFRMNVSVCNPYNADFDKLPLMSNN